MSELFTMDGGRSIPPELGSLARGVPDPKPGMIYALGLEGGVAFAPKEGRSVLFGRNKDEVHVCVGGNDQRVSRRHGLVTRHGDLWWMSTIGKIPVRLPGSRRVVAGDEPVALPTGYTPVFLRGSRRREHLLELFVVGDGGHRPQDVHTATTDHGIWSLTAEERVVLAAMAERYLLHDVFPQPLSRGDTAAILARLQPEAAWSEKRVERVVAKVRMRLSRQGVAFLTRDEVREPVGNTLNHNLITELLDTATLVPTDLRLVQVD